MRGDVIEIFPTYDDNAYRIEMFGDEVESLTQIDPLFGTLKQRYMRLPIYPKTHYVMKDETRVTAVASIQGGTARGGKSNSRSRVELSSRSASISGAMYDLEMIKAMGYCHGIENYSRHFTGRMPGEPPPTLLDYFPRDFPDVHRRVAPDGAATARHVSRRPLAQADPG